MRPPTSAVGLSLWLMLSLLAAAAFPGDTKPVQAVGGSQLQQVTIEVAITGGTIVVHAPLLTAPEQEQAQNEDSSAVVEQTDHNKLIAARLSSIGTGRFSSSSPPPSGLSLPPSSLPPPSPAPPRPSPNGPSGGNSTKPHDDDISKSEMGLIIGLVVGILGLIVVSVLLYFLWEYRKERLRRRYTPELMEALAGMEAEQRAKEAALLDDEEAGMSQRTASREEPGTRKAAGGEAEAHAAAGLGPGLPYGSAAAASRGAGSSTGDGQGRGWFSSACGALCGKLHGRHGGSAAGQEAEEIAAAARPVMRNMPRTMRQGVDQALAPVVSETNGLPEVMLEMAPSDVSSLSSVHSLGGSRKLSVSRNRTGRKLWGSVSLSREASGGAAATAPAWASAASASSMVGSGPASVPGAFGMPRAPVLPSAFGAAALMGARGPPVQRRGNSAAEIAAATAAMQETLAAGDQATAAARDALAAGGAGAGSVRRTSLASVVAALEAEVQRLCSVQQQLLVQQSAPSGGDGSSGSSGPSLTKQRRLSEITPATLGSGELDAILQQQKLEEEHWQQQKLQQEQQRQQQQQRATEVVAAAVTATPLAAASAAATEATPAAEHGPAARSLSRSSNKSNSPRPRSRSQIPGLPEPPALPPSSPNSVKAAAIVPTNSRDPSLSRIPRPVPITAPRSPVRAAQPSSSAPRSPPAPAAVRRSAIAGAFSPASPQRQILPRSGSASASKSAGLSSGGGAAAGAAGPGGQAAARSVRVQAMQQPVPLLALARIGSVTRGPIREALPEDEEADLGLPLPPPPEVLAAAAPARLSPPHKVEDIPPWRVEAPAVAAGNGGLTRAASMAPRTAVREDIPEDEEADLGLPLPASASAASSVWASLGVAAGADEAAAGMAAAGAGDAFATVHGSPAQPPVMSSTGVARSASLTRKATPSPRRVV